LSITSGPSSSRPASAPTASICSDVGFTAMA